MSIAFAAQCSSRFWSRLVLLSGLKLSADKLYRDVFKRLQKRYVNIRRLRTNNNSSKRFSKFMPLVYVSFHQSCPGFDGMRSVLFQQRRLFPMLFFSTIRQIFCLSLLLLMRPWCPSNLSFVNTAGTLQLFF